jgi:transcriptional regulator with XRE-family HTH domain
MLVAEGRGFAARLKTLREASGLSPYQLGKKAKLSGQAIALLEDGRRQPTWDTVLKIARALNVSVAEFDTGEQFDAHDEPTPPEPSVDTSLEPTPLERESPSPEPPSPPPTPKPPRKK